VQPKQSTLLNSKPMESATVDDSHETSEISSSDQITSGDTSSAAETSDSTSNSASEPGSSDSDSSTDDENTTSDTDEEISEEETDSSTDTAKTSGNISQPSKLLSDASPNIIPSETLYPTFIKQLDTAFMLSTPNVDQVRTKNDSVSQVANWDDLKPIDNPHASTSGTDSTQSESSKSDSSVCESTIPAKAKHPSDYGKSILIQNAVEAAKTNIKFDSSSHEKSDSDKNCLPPELAGGWGEEPGPAPWDWQAMPFDYMGILEEQRRTVFYEFHEHNGKGEWIDPKYEGLPSKEISDCRFEI
jgi:hypothetical protein